MAKVKTTRWDAAEHLRDDEDVAAYLEAALDDGDHRIVAAALGDIARAKGMGRVAGNAGLSRESLYKSLSIHGNPEFGTILKVVKALGIRLTATVIGDGHRRNTGPIEANMLADEGEPFGIESKSDRGL